MQQVSRTPPAEYCRHCGNVGPPAEECERHYGPGFILLFALFIVSVVGFILLFIEHDYTACVSTALFGILPWLIYLARGLHKKWYIVCEKCQTRGTLIPLDSPVARAKLKTARETK